MLTASSSEVLNQPISPAWLMQQSISKYLGPPTLFPIKNDGFSIWAPNPAPARANFLPDSLCFTMVTNFMFLVDLINSSRAAVAPVRDTPVPGSAVTSIIEKYTGNRSILLFLLQ